MSAIHHFDYGLPTRIGIPFGVAGAILWPAIPFAIYRGSDWFIGGPQTRPFLTNMSIWVALVLLGGWLLGLYAQARSATDKASLDLDDQGITAFVLGMRWRQIAWHEVERIEKQRIFVGGRFGTRMYIDIFGRSKRVRIIQSIRDYDRLVGLLNEYIQRFAIPALFQDRGYDTVEAAKTKADKTEWRRINREGVRTTVTHL